MIIRKAEKKDVQALYEINKAEIPQVSHIEEEDIHWFIGNAHRFEVAEINGELAGLLLVFKNGSEYESDNYRWFCERYEDFIYVDRIIVSEQFKRRGIGSTFYYRLIQESGEENVPLTCEVNLQPSNEASMEFHKKLGFTEVGQKKTANGNKLVCMMARN